LVPGDVGLSAQQVTEAVLFAPSTRPGRYTVLEYLNLSESAARGAVESFIREYGS
ncbi:MAG: 3-dehydroquinate synthase, partial [Streptosporangiaceae bacterium]